MESYPPSPSLHLFADMEKRLLHCWIFAYALLVIAITTFHIPPSCLAQSSNRSLATDQAALLALKSHVTSDPSRILATNWTESSPVCSWYGVTCALRHQRVYALNLSNLNLSGTIPPQLGQLSFLAYLDLKSNNFSGALPQDLSLLRRLKLISLRINNFSGDIPPLFSRFPKLKYLNFRNNTFTGTIPKSLSNLTNLQYLNLNYNSLSGEIPQELGRLQNLQYLWIEFNHLSGGIPSAIFNVSSLVGIGFAGNELSGSLPRDLCRDLPSLAYIYLPDNRLTGSIPTNLSQCSQLEDLSLSYNSFSGPIPAEIGSLTSLRYLGLGGNNLNGTLPREIGNLQNLFVFAVEINKIEGPIDFKIFTNMSSLDTLLLWRNRFTGSLSRDIGNLTTLIMLDIPENNFTGVIPSEIGQLYQLDRLKLGLNSFSGSIPHELFNISTIRILGVDLNDLSGILPTSLCQGTPFLEELYLGTNFITGPIPNSISNCSQLKFLVLSNNKFSGHIPAHLGDLRHLQALYLSDNNLTNAPSEVDFLTSLTNCRFLTSLQIGGNPLNRTIPPSVGNLSSRLQLLDIDNSNLNGHIPDEIGNLSSLMSLDLHGNELNGNIPHTIKHLHELQGLYLPDNMLGGSIPEAICDLHSLSYIDISRNQFSGPIPKCLGDVPSLRNIFLGSNILNSSIPPTLWDLKDLTQIDLSSNSLTGFLPPEISNLVGAIYIDLSLNKLSGSIPNTIGKFQNLVNLSLAHNRLEGPIPVSVGSMTDLVTLDMSYNNLSGSIPKSLEALQHLHHFNVSFNSLSGEIPNGGSFKNITAESFKGNEALCGVPRFHVQICSAVSNHKSKRNEVKLALFIILGVVGFVMVISLAFLFVRYKKKGKATSRVDELLSIEPERISYYELVQATEHFSESNLLGTGSSCSVYKGTLNNGKVIALKVFNMLLEGTSRRFDVECEILRNIRHRNLTSVISSCSNEEFKALVLEYMPKGNLDQWLYSHNYCLSVMERLNIMIDVASALEYLHHGYSTSIVHSDMKPSNVLLDEDLVAHVSDFGIAKLLSNGDSFVLTNTFATLGYIAPEYGLEGLVSTRCDMYSYGITLMETFTRKRPSDEMFVGDLNLKGWVENSLAVMPDEVIDANLVMNMEEEQFNKNMQCASSVLELALKCSANSPMDRINMKEAHSELQKIKRLFLQ